MKHIVLKLPFVGAFICPIEPSIPTFCSIPKCPLVLGTILVVLFSFTVKGLIQPVSLIARPIL